MMEANGVSRGELARRLEVSPAYITKVLRGNVNFTLDSMVRLVRGAGGRSVFRLHQRLRRKETIFIENKG